MSTPDAKTEIDRLLTEAVADLKAADAAAAGRLNVFQLQHAGGIAGLLGRPDLAARLGVLTSRFTLGDVLGGALTNIDLATVDLARPCSAWSSDDAARHHPACDDASVLQRMASEPTDHVRLCLAGDVDGAARAARDRLSAEDVGATLAALGQFDRATAFVDAHPAADDRARAHVRFIVLLETCRRAPAGFGGAIRRAQPAGFDRLHVIAALAQRLPWPGYPYSDY